MKHNTRKLNKLVLIAISGCVLIFYYHSGFPEKLRFFAETIDIEVEKNQIRVKGIYHFRNRMPLPVFQRFYYPVSREDGLLPPVLLTIRQLSPNYQPISVTRSGNNFQFSLNFDAKQSITFEVQYLQIAPECKAAYILTTTKTWKKPLQSAFYRLTFRDADLIDSNYTLKKESHDSYTFEMYNFMPDEDWHFSWKYLNQKGSEQ